MKPSIFVIDDESDLLELYKNVLNEHFFVEEFYDVFSALAVLQKSRPPDVILMDCRMPDLNGIEFIIKIKKLGIQTPVILVTGITQKTIGIEAMTKGAFSYIEKPLDFDSLKVVCREAAQFYQTIAP